MAYFGVDVGNLSLDPFLDRRTEYYIGRVEYEADFATITSITALKQLRISDGGDIEGSSLDVIDQYRNERSKQFTQEMRSTSDPSGTASLGEALVWIIDAVSHRHRSARNAQIHFSD